MSQPRTRVLVAGLACSLALATALLYAPALAHDFVHYDDPLYVTGSPNVQRGLTLESVRWALGVNHARNWYPLTLLSHMLDVELYGLDPAGHHATSVALHSLNVVLFFLLLQRATGAYWRSALAAALFGLHPLRVESVAWVAERKDVLSVAFGLAAMLAYLWYVKAPSARRMLVLAGLHAAALMSKSMLVTLPFLLLLLDGWPLRRTQREAVGKAARRSWAALALEKWPLFALSAAAAVVALLTQQSAMIAMQQLPLSLRLANAFAGYWLYLAKTVWPVDLAVLYPHPGADLPLVLGALACVAVVAASLLAFAQRHDRCWLTVGWFWFVGTLVPVIGIVQVGIQAIADRYSYLPHMGLALAIAWSLPDLRRLTLFAGWMLRVAVVALLLALCAATSAQLRHWRDSVALFERLVAVTQNNALGHINLAEAYQHVGRVEDHLTQTRIAASLEPRYGPHLYNAARRAAARGQSQLARTLYREVIAQRPDLAEAHNSLGVLIEAAGDRGQALQHFDDALRANPDSSAALANRGRLRLAAGQGPLGEDDLAASLRIDPDQPEVRRLLASWLSRSGRAEQAAALMRDGVP